MKKFYVLSLLLASLVTTHASFGMECDGLKGIWGETPTKLKIHDPNPLEYAEVELSANNRTYNYGLLSGSCTKNHDGTVTISLKRNSYQVKGEVKARLLNNGELSLEKFEFSGPEGNYSVNSVLKRCHRDLC